MLKVWKMLLVPLLFATLLATGVTLRSYLWRDRIVSPECACILNLKMLEGAKAMSVLERKGTNDAVSWDDIIGKTNYLSVKPMCPRGGIYTLGAVGAPARCTIPDHVLPKGWSATD